MPALRRLRKRALISVKQLAEQLEVSEQSIYMWEAGRTEPKVEHIRKLAQTFQVEVDTVLDAIEQDQQSKKQKDRVA